MMGQSQILPNSRSSCHVFIVVEGTSTWSARLFRGCNSPVEDICVEILNSSRTTIIIWPLGSSSVALMIREVYKPVCGEGIYFAPLKYTYVERPNTSRFLESICPRGSSRVPSLRSAIESDLPTPSSGRLAMARRFIPLEQQSKILWRQASWRICL